MDSPRPARAHRDRRRGQPLLFLVTVLVCWTLARIIHHLPDTAELAAPRPIQWLPSRLLTTSPMDRAVLPRPEDMMGLAALPPVQPAFRPQPVVETGAAEAIDVDTALAHHRLWAQSLTPSARAGGGAPLFDGPLLIEPEADRPQNAEGAADPGRHRRWSIYAWSLVRPSGGDAALAPVGQYGGSQAGLILRYAIGGGASALSLYARATSALARDDDRTMAFGVSARPFARIPVDLAVERRLSLVDGQPDRFAAMVVAGGGTSLARSQLRVEAFGQAGVVGLADRQGFFDLQMLAAREVSTRDRHSVSVGGGIWAGGQQQHDAADRKRWVYRVDMGPRAALAVPLGDSQMMVALDWRQRIDGNARPASGAALTLSTGF